MQIATFMATSLGRGVRVALGILLIVIGITVGGTVGWLIAIVGLVPIVAGVANVCLIAPVIGAPFRGSNAR